MIPKKASQLTNGVTKILKQFKYTWIFILILALVSNNTAFAAAKKLTATEKKTYKKCLENYITKTNWPEWWTSHISIDATKECTQFALADINGDGKKELLVYSCGGASWQWFAAYKANGKSIKFKYYDNKKLKSKTTKSSQRSVLIYITKISNKAFMDDYESHNGVNVHTYYSKKKGNIVEVAKLAQIYDNEKCKTISTYYVNGKKTTKEKYKKRIKRLGKFKSIKYYNYKDANKHLK